MNAPQGFLNTNGSPSKRAQVANYGLMDQMAALQWIKENIQQFGGDPNRVTLFGHGTGAACIEYLVHSPTTVPGIMFQYFLKLEYALFDTQYLLISTYISTNI